MNFGRRVEDLKGIFFFIFVSLLFAQETHNLEIIWTIPGNPNLNLFGYNSVSGDVDGDGHLDILVAGDTYTGTG
ncbi:MAG: FG-GAP repeat protein, partial [candidate division WOR-3 bacterium]|nr:FG-GAP repeat protein [candidate division WOR-3 bacterium]